MPGFFILQYLFPIQMKAKHVVITGILAFTFLLACTNNAQKADQTQEENQTENQDSSCAPETIKDPNNPKPMALMMRQLAQNADSMKAQLQRGEAIDSLKYPFIRFYLAEPTDPNVLEPLFYENARLFQQAYVALFSHKNEQVKYYNLMIGKCVNCHESYCSGPLKKIRKLFVTN